MPKLSEAGCTFDVSLVVVTRWLGVDEFFVNVVVPLMGRGLSDE